MAENFIGWPPKRSKPNQESVEYQLESIELNPEDENPYTDDELVQKSSAGMSLCGVLLSGNYEDMVQSREQVLAFPKELTLTNPLFSQTQKYETFVNRVSEERFQKCLFTLGVSATMSQIDLLKVQQDFDEKYVCESKYVTIAKKAWPLKLSNVRLSQNIIWRLQDTEDENNEGSVTESITSIFKQFGSHIFKGPVQYGGIYKQSSSVEGFPVDKVEEVRKFVEDDLKASMEHNETGEQSLKNLQSSYAGRHGVAKNDKSGQSYDFKQFGSHILKGPVQHGGMYKRSAHAMVSPYSKRPETRKYAEDDLKAIHRKNYETGQHLHRVNDVPSETVTYCVHRDISKNGGPSQSCNFSSWQKGLECSSTWQVIDRGDEFIPIWDIIKHHHKEEFTNYHKVCNSLITVYKGMASGLDIQTLQSLTKSFIESMVIQYYPKQLEFLYKLKKEIEVKLSHDSKWWINCLGNEYLPKFCRTIVEIEEVTYTAMEKLNRERLKILIRRLIEEYKQDIIAKGWSDQWDKVFVFIQSPMENITKNIQNPKLEEFSDIALYTITQMQKPHSRKAEIITAFANSLKLIIQSLHANRRYLEEMMFSLLLEQYDFDYRKFVFQGQIDYLLIHEMVQYIDDGSKQLNRAEQISPEKAERSTLLWCLSLPKKCHDTYYPMGKMRATFSEWTKYFTPIVGSLLEAFIANTKQTQEEFESTLLGNSTGYFVEMLIKDKVQLKASSMEEVLYVDHKSPLFSIRKRLGLPIKSPMQMSDVICVNNLLNTCSEDVEEKDAAMWFLNKLIKLDYENMYAFYKADSFQEKIEETDIDNLWDGDSDQDDLELADNTIHQSDILVAILLSSSMVVQQFIFTKLAMCQLALPIVIGNPNEQMKMFFLWASRNISRTWKTKHKDTQEEISHEERMAVCPTHIVSFVRLGSHASITKSKSNILNHILYNQKHNVFLDRSCNKYKHSRKLAEGMVELAWYHPTLDDDDGPFDQTLTFLNLRGDGKEHASTLNFVLQASNILVVLGSKKEMRLFQEKIDNSENKNIIFLSEETDKCLRSEGKVKLGIKGKMEIQIAAKIVHEINYLLRKPRQKKSSLEELQGIALKCDIQVDEHDNDCKIPKQKAQELICMLQGTPIAKFKETFLSLHRQMWNKWCLLDRKLHNLQVEPGTDQELLRSEIEDEQRNCRVRQRKKQNSKFIKKFYKALFELKPSTHATYFNWVAYYLELETKPEILKLTNKYRQLCSSGADLESINIVDDQLIKSSLGLEHILREINQLYTAVSETEYHENIEYMSCLPSLIADLFIAGQPIELMDGDVSHLPLKWINAVLGETSEKLGNPKIFVVSVLGVQSTGKSTLLNSMFGLQFAVSPGRCTRGAFMQLLRIDKELHEEFGYEYMLVVDTEGLKSSEIAQLSSSSEHDNRLTSFVIGIGDVTIINIAGESVSDMEGLLEIAVQAFIRMGKVNISPSAFFLHQNVSAVNAKDKNLKARRKLEERLDRMTCLAAHEEGTTGEHKHFNDVISFNDQSVDYISGLLKGDPPMAPPNPGYSIKVHKLQQRLMRIPHQKKRISEFIPRVTDLWTALQCENFVFSFKNTFEISVYTKVENVYTNSRVKLHSAKLDLEKRKCNEIRNEKIPCESLLNKINTEIEQVMGKEYNNICMNLKKLFEHDDDKETLQKWKFITEQNIQSLNERLQEEAKGNCKDCFDNKKTLMIVEDQKHDYEYRIIKHAQDLANKLKGFKVTKGQLKKEFEDKIWQGVYNEVTALSSKEKPVDIAADAAVVLNNTYRNVNPDLQQKMSATSLRSEKYTNFTFDTKLHLVDKGIWKKFTQIVGIHANQHKQYVDGLLDTIRKKLRNYLKEKLHSKTDYSLSFFYEIIQEMDSELQVENQLSEKSDVTMFKPHFKVDLALHLFSIAIKSLKKMHVQYIQETSPKVYLERKRKVYYEAFKDLFEGARACNIAVELFLEDFPDAVEAAARQSIGIVIGNILTSTHAAFKGNRSNLEKYILKELAEKKHFGAYMTYINQPKEAIYDYIEKEVEKWCTRKIGRGKKRIDKYIEIEYRDLEDVVVSAIADTTNCKAYKGISQWTNLFLANITIKEQLNIGKCIQRIKDLDIDSNDISLFSTELTSRIPEVFKRLIEKVKAEGLGHLIDVKTHPATIIKNNLTGCWQQCPFCGSLCTNTLENHTGDHSRDFHRPKGLHGAHRRTTNKLSTSICTNIVGSSASFQPRYDDETTFAYRVYRTVGEPYSNWKITYDSSEKAYWKWVICHFQADLEKFWGRKFRQIPLLWQTVTQAKAIQEVSEAPKLG